MLSWDKFYVVTWLALLKQKLCGTECNAGQIISTDRSIHTQHGNQSLINRCSNVFNFGFASIFQWFSLDSNVQKSDSKCNTKSAQTIFQKDDEVPIWKFPWFLLKMKTH